MIIERVNLAAKTILSIRKMKVVFVIHFVSLCIATTFLFYIIDDSVGTTSFSLRTWFVDYKKVKSFIGKMEKHSYHRYEMYAQQLIQQYGDALYNCYMANRKECITKTTKEYKHMKYANRDVLLSYTENATVQPTKIHPNVSVIIGIPLAPYQFVERMVFRSTLCRPEYLTNNTICLFFSSMEGERADVNRLIREEGVIHDDIVQFDFMNDYINLTTLQLSTARWIMKMYPAIQYYIRTDSDVYFDYDYVRNNVLNKPSRRLAFGHIWRKSPPQRKPGQKWYLPTSIYNETYYKPYLGGYMYLWSRDIFPLIIEGSTFIKPIHYIDDVYLGQIMFHYNISLVDNRDRMSSSVLKLDSSLKAKIVGKFAIHGYSPLELLLLWRLFKNI